MSGKGKRFELKLKNDINDHTDKYVKAHRPDYSGSSKGEVADLMIVWQPKNNVTKVHGSLGCVTYLEVKKRQAEEGKRCTVMSGSAKGQNGIEELRELVEESPPWSQPWVAIKFNQRELIMIPAADLIYDLVNDHQQYHGARLTPSGNISMIKPTLDEWPSSTAGLDDYAKILSAIGIEHD